MKESNFASEIKRSCEVVNNCFYYKIPDSYMGERFLVKKPFDAFIVCNNKFIAIEFKMHKVVGVNGVGAFPFICVKDHQVEGLQKVVNAGGRGLVMVNFRINYLKFTKNQFITKSINKTYYIDVAKFGLQQYRHNKINKKSIPYSEIQISWRELTRTSRDLTGKLCWDIEGVLK